MAKSLAVILPREIKHIRHISDDEYAKYKSSLSEIQTLDTYQTLFSVLSANYTDYQETCMRHLKNYTESDRLHGPDDRDHLRILIDINRSLINYLSACRAYTDHCEKLLKSKFGPTSDEWKRYKDKFDTEYSNNVSLRLMSALRNSAQHQAMPIVKFQLNSLIEEEDKSQITYSFVALTARDPILGTKRLPLDVKAEIQALPPAFDIYPHMIELWESIRRINLVALNLVLQVAAEPAQFLAWLMQGIRNGAPCITDFDAWTPIGRSELILERFPVATVKMVMDILENKDNRYRRHT